MNSKFLYKLAFIVNPISGGGLGDWVMKKLPEILPTFGYKREEWAAIKTKETAEDDRIQALLKTAQKVIAVGGDGTIGQVLNTLKSLPSTPIVGLIPLGTGNDLARILGIYKIYHQKGLIACIKRLLKANSTKFDLWQVNQNHTLAAYLSIGIDAAILSGFDTFRKKSRISNAYLNKLIYAIEFFKRFPFRISGHSTLELISDRGVEQIELNGKVNCIVSNINSYAAGAKPFSYCAFNDKKLSIFVAASPWQYLLHAVLSRLLPNLTRFVMPKSCFFTSSSIILRNLSNEFLQLDGENISDYPWQQLEISFAKRVSFIDLRKHPFNVFQ